MTVSVCGRFGLCLFRFVVLTFCDCSLFGCGCFRLWPSLPVSPVVTFKETKQNLVNFFIMPKTVLHVSDLMYTFCCPQVIPIPCNMLGDYVVLSFLFKAFSACDRFGLRPFRFVAFSVYVRFWIVAVSGFLAFWLWPSWRVAVMTCYPC